MLVLDEDISRDLIRERKRLGHDHHDEVWDGVYVMPSMPNLVHQKLVNAFAAIFEEVVVEPARGDAYPGANVSDRRDDWKSNHRVPDLVVVLRDSRAVNCITHFFGGPDFLIEIESPGDETEEKMPFYSQIHVRELLIMHRDARRLRLYRHNGRSLTLVGDSETAPEDWIASEVVPLSFRWKSTKAGPRTEVKRTDGKRRTWTM